MKHKQGDFKGTIFRLLLDFPFDLPGNKKNGKFFFCILKDIIFNLNFFPSGSNLFNVSQAKKSMVTLVKAELALIKA